MAEKLGQGVIWEGPPPAPGQDAKEAEREAELARLRGRRDASRATLVIGVAMMFAAGFSVALAVGGALMVLGGMASSIYWSTRIRRLQGDPWHDPEIDAWEEEHYGR